MRKPAAGLAGVVILGLAVLVAHLHAGAAPQKVRVEAKEFAYVPNRITVQAGRPVEILLVNRGVIEHDFVIDRFKVKTGLIKPAQSGTVTFTPSAKGTFPFYCSVPGHKEAGMTGTLVVQ